MVDLTRDEHGRPGATVHLAGLQAVAQGLPVTHGLAAVRAMLAGGAPDEVARQAALELAVAVGWFTVALLTFRRFAESGRRNGSIEFS